MLLREGFAEAVANRFERPAGLIPATRDPAALALSIISEIIDRFQTLQATISLAEFPERMVAAAE